MLDAGRVASDPTEDVTISPEFGFGPKIGAELEM